jgi:hypothetical protein
MVPHFNIGEEAFWFFGDSYKAGAPTEIYVLNPRKMRAQVHGRAVRNQRPAWTENGVVRRWFYSTDKDKVPILPWSCASLGWSQISSAARLCVPTARVCNLPDEIIHFKKWNPWNETRGVTPLIALSREIEQDQRANSAPTKLLRNNAVPEGILKTDQVLREEEADKLERRWNLYTILAKHGIPPRVDWNKKNGEISGTVLLGLFQ